MANFKRRPNKSGTVVKLSGKRSKPFMAKVTIGYREDNGAQIQKPLGYFESREEALNALSLYSLSKKQGMQDQQLQQLGGSLYQSITNFNNSGLPTFKDIYQLIYINDIEKLSKQRRGAYDAAFKRLTNIADKKINEITLFNMQQCIDTSREEVGEKTLFDMKALCVKVFKYAVIHQYINRDQDFSEYINASKKENKTSKHRPFELEEVKQIAQDNSIEAKIVLTYILTGCRPIELLKINLDNVFIDVEDNGSQISYMITGSKTEAGTNRIIPIHNIIKPFIIDVLMVLTKIEYHKYTSNYFYPLMKKYNFNHIPYDARYTFATLAKLCSVDDFYRKRIMGHKAQDITDDIYTGTYKFKIFEEINKIELA